MTSSSTSPYTDAYVTETRPHDCGLLIQRIKAKLESLSKHLVDLGHLKRVKRLSPNLCDCSDKSTTSRSNTRDDSSSITKRARHSQAENVRLFVLLGHANSMDDFFSSDTKEDTGPVSKILEAFGVSNVQKIKVPLRAALSNIEWKEFNAMWPTNYFAEMTMEFQEEQRKLSEDDIRYMKMGLDEAVKDKCSSLTKEGTVIISPSDGSILSRSAEEGRLQENMLPNFHYSNPLATSLIFAIQGISRREREAASNLGMQNQEFTGGQYICTGLDVFTTREPNVFEAMALVHSRIRRLVFIHSSEGDVGGITKMFVHDLPGTNHNYRAFQLLTE